LTNENTLLSDLCVFAAALQVMSDFRAFFADKRNARAVYRPGPGARHEFAHAITLVGYNNQQQYWLAKNSYGSSWGDGGFFRVSLLLLVMATFAAGGGCC
jgi:C1A family cysteine protease